MGLHTGIKISRTGIVLMTAVILVVSKIFQFACLPAKYFYDSTFIMSLMNHPSKSLLEGSYETTAIIFDKINIFGFSSLSQWATALTVVFGIALCFYVRKEYTRSDVLNFVYLIASIFLTGVYVFNISKDIIQLLIFFLAYLFASSRIIKSNGVKIAGCCILFFAECVIFRRYYILTAVFCPIMYWMLKTAGIAGAGGKRKRTNIFLSGLSVIAVLFVFLTFAKRFMPDEYINLITVRSGVNGNRENSPDAVTIINDIYASDGNLFIWFVNYIINAVRMLFPFELLLKGIKYVPFVVYQILVTYYLFRAVRRFNGLAPRLRIMISVAVAFFLVSFMFEPDFGSWIRHETACLPIMLPIAVSETESAASADDKQYGTERICRE